MGRSHRNCCVVNCSNTELLNPDLNFYRFPGKPWETERHMKWIVAVRRSGIDAQLWEPTGNTRICSVHFVGGKKSEEVNHVSYVPTLFPECYKEKRKAGSDTARYERRMKRASKEAYLPDVPDVPDVQDLPEIETTFKEVGNQAFDSDYDDPHFIFECNVHYMNLGIQCNIPTNHHAWNKETPHVDSTSEPKEYEGWFHGFSEKVTEKHLKELASTSHDIFALLLSFLTDLGPSKLSNENALLLFLMKIKLGLPFTVLGILYGVHRTTASRTFLHVLTVLAGKTKNFIYWPSKFATGFCAPPAFKELYLNVRIIIDCTEIKTEIPSSVSEQVFMYSSYKGAHTFKFLVAVTPNGAVCFKSPCYGGKVSDAYITNNCGLLELLEDGDVVLADKGFPGIRLKDNQVIVMPPFLKNGRFSRDEVLQTRSVASVRIHVERCIQRIKIYQILKHVTSELYPVIDDVHVCCVLANFLPPIIKDK